MNQHTPPPGPVPASQSTMPRGRAKLVALEVAAELAGEIHRMQIPHRLAHLQDHLVRAAEQLTASSRASTSSSRSEDDCGSRLIGVSHKPRSGAVTRC